MNIKKKSTTILEHQKADIDIPYELSRQKISFWLPKDESADIVERMPKIMIKFKYLQQLLQCVWSGSGVRKSVSIHGIHIPGSSKTVLSIVLMPHPMIKLIPVIFSSVVLKESKYKIVRNNSTTCNGKNYYLRSCDGPN